LRLQHSTDFRALPPPPFHLMRQEFIAATENEYATIADMPPPPTPSPTDTLLNGRADRRPVTELVLVPVMSQHHTLNKVSTSQSMQRMLTIQDYTRRTNFYNGPHKELAMLPDNKLQRAYEVAPIMTPAHSIIKSREQSLMTSCMTQSVMASHLKQSLTASCLEQVMLPYTVDSGMYSANTESYSTRANCSHQISFSPPPVDDDDEDAFIYHYSDSSKYFQFDTNGRRLSNAPSYDSHKTLPIRHTNNAPGGDSCVWQKSIGGPPDLTKNSVDVLACCQTV